MMARAQSTWFERFAEKCGHYVFGVVTAVVWICIYRWTVPDAERMTTLFAAALNISAISAGFLGTAAGIMLSIHDREIVAKLRGMRKYGLLISYVQEAVILTILLAGYSMAALLVDLSTVTTSKAVAVWLGVLLGAVAAGACVRVVYFLLRILHTIANEPATRPPERTEE